jgi:hypothetical protein
VRTKSEQPRPIGPNSSTGPQRSWGRSREQLLPNLSAQQLQKMYSFETGRVGRRQKAASVNAPLLVFRVC